MAKNDVVLLHGWMMEPGMWAHQEEALADVGRPHAIIQPGHGVAVSRLRQQATKVDENQQAMMKDAASRGVLTVEGGQPRLTTPDFFIPWRR